MIYGARLLVAGIAIWGITFCFVLVDRLLARRDERETRGGIYNLKTFGIAALFVLGLALGLAGWIMGL